MAHQEAAQRVKEQFAVGDYAALQAPTGWAKSTAFMEELQKVLRVMIVILQPRRIAARSLAQRVKAGGYIIGGENKTAKSTKLIYVTGGIPQKMVAQWPPGGVLAIDEVRIEAEYIDAAFACVPAILARGGKLLVLSACIPGRITTLRFGAIS